MKRLAIIFLCVLLTGCVTQTVILEQIPEGGLAAPDDLPEQDTVILDIPPITGEGFVSDPLGVPILRPDTHYADNYLTYSSVRIYEYGDSTFMDAICFNSFTQPLAGGARLVYYKDGKVYGIGDIYTAEGGLTLQVGSNRVYATILTEIDVRLMDFVIEVTKPFKPVD
ncbi:MAG: hypothetical protein FWE69_00675 [Clostridiales bacterium]|nr:hypothetical protein [Clostridiales bacterium]